MASNTKHWANHSCGKVFCLVEAPDAETAMQVHREAHGHVAEKIIEVDPPELIDAFLGSGEVSEAGAALLPGTAGVRDSACRTVIFADIVGWTSFTQELGDDKAMELVHLHDTIVRQALGAENGREVKHTGDGIMASFFFGGCGGALQIQRGLARRTPDELPLKVPDRGRGRRTGRTCERHLRVNSAVDGAASVPLRHPSRSPFLMSSRSSVLVRA